MCIYIKFRVRIFFAFNVLLLAQCVIPLLLLWTIYREKESIILYLHAFGFINDSRNSFQEKTDLPIKKKREKKNIKH